MRLKLRKIPKKEVELILEHPQNQYYDVATKNLIAIGRTTINRKNMLLSVAFQDIFGETIVITAHPITNTQVQNRVLKARWIKV
ncbi:MAG: hypothetical protein HYT97_02305 [Elusimicrobia bacterium]|nr:hypothetical protein [Elusimicrobiota bacterium]